VRQCEFLAHEKASHGQLEKSEEYKTIVINRQGSKIGSQILIG